jgi:uncharacterized protein YndB with AHSA1/START domain
MVEIVLEQDVAAEPRRVWELVANHEGMKKWMPVREVVRRRPGSPDPDGVGAVRTIRGSGLVIEERITAFKPPERLEYVLIEGAPVRDHHGEVLLEPRAGGGTHVRWRVRFRPLVPGTGWLLERMLRRALERGLEGLKRRAEA